MEDAYKINGGIPLKGQVKLSGAKNIALKAVIASLMFKGAVELQNIPRILDIEELLNLIKLLGGRAEFVKSNTVVIDGANIKSNKIDLLHASKIRVSFMFFAPLLTALGEAIIPNPGGCRIGARPIDRQIEFMKALGVSVKYNAEDGFYRARLEKGLVGGYFKFDKPSHTGTEFAILLAIFAKGQTIVDNASLEPEIDDLITFLNMSGAQIKRSGRKIIIEGVKSLTQRGEYKIANDRNEAVTFAVFALATGGEITINGISATMIQSFIDVAKKAGAGIKIEKNNIKFFYNGSLGATDIVTGPFPGFMTDWQAPWAVLMTQAAGVSTIHESVFENRFSYVSELLKLGAKIDFFKPEVKSPEKFYQFNLGKNYQKLGSQAIKITGKTPLHNGVLKVGDLRAGVSLIIAAAIAGGESIVEGASVIDRGYEEIDKKLIALGAKIKKI